MNKQQFSAYIKQFNFRELFNDMGWNNDCTTQPIVIDNDTYTLQAVAEKSGYKILLCNPLSNGIIPDYSTRKKIETKVTKLFHEHLIIFFDAAKTEQIWQFVVRQAGKPTKVTETRWSTSQAPELLYQRTAGIFFTMDEEEHITIVDVTQRMTENFNQNNEKITKKFYEQFKKEHTAFLDFIKGIGERTNQEWYASLMLNRLMFCYFIQKKGFLDNNKNYLREKLNACREKRGANKFYSFYRDFLLLLFHKGLNNPEQSEETKIEIGKIPYLNGGLFDEHEIERTHDSIDIDDRAFERIFDFFDQYEWHLDTSVTATGKDINPDVIGYIFEKYINDRAAMGAYYTKEDITDYISKNCILPFLFDEMQKKYQGNLENLIKITVQTSDDRYIYDAVKKGYSNDWREKVPVEIAQGIDTAQPNLFERRAKWNTPANTDFALPTEIWRETIERLQRCETISRKIANGEITQINDFITYNLNIRQFAQDMLENTADPEFLRHFYRALTTVTILDPTCGSGAFLFAAMNILEPLYEANIRRMENFVAEAPKGKHKFFEEVLAQVNAAEHPNLQYFIFKSIILRNLYGVDIMQEAVETAKLRLFLKLVATVEADYRKPNLGLEPLPDIDFNIRCGNTLIGFATEADLDKTFVGTLDFDNAKDLLTEKCDIVAKAFERYKQIQLSYGDDFTDFKVAKEELNKRLKELNAELNQLLHKQYASIPYNQWLASYQPFHWFAEFYEIIHDKGGFDVIIGNPPYVEYSKVKKDYQIQNYETEKCENLYAFVIERAMKILRNRNNMGMIIPLTFIANNNMSELRKFLTKFGNFYCSSFEIRPSALFEGVEQRLTIFIFRQSITHIFSTSIQRWKPEQRKGLFQQLHYVPTFYNGTIWRLSSLIENEIYEKFTKHKSINFYISDRKTEQNILHYRTAGVRYWIIFKNDGFQSNSLSNKIVSFDEKFSSKEMMVILNSNLFWWYYATNYDMFNLKDYMIFSFRYDAQNDAQLIYISDALENDLNNNKQLLITNSKTRGTVESYIFLKKKSKPIIDEIDKVLAAHYGFTEEELDFIINYDIKYRMGKELEEE